MRREPSWTRRDAVAFTAIVLGAFLVRLAFVLAVHPTPVSDFGWYYARALEISHGLGYTVHGFPTAFWPPGWPYFLAGVIRVFGPNPLAAEVVQALLNTMTVALVFLMGRAIAGRACAVAAAVAYALLPSAVEWCATLASEPLYTLLWVSVTYIWMKYSPRQLFWFALSGLLLGGAALVRPSALLLWVVLLGYLITIRSERHRPLQILKAAAITLCCMIAVVTPEIVRNSAVFHTFVLISNNGGVSLYQGNNPTSGGGVTDLPNGVVARLMSDPRNEAVADQLASRLALEYMRTHPGRELWLVAQRLKALYGRDDLVIRFTLRADHFHEKVSPPRSDRIATNFVTLNTVAYYALMVWALLGIVVALRSIGSDENPAWRLPLGMILYNTALFMLAGAFDRYRYPIMPYFSVFAGIGLAAAFLFVRGRKNALAPVRAHAEV